MADQWGANSTNQTKPTWEYLRSSRGRLGTTSDVYAGPNGWRMRHPWGDELLVATAINLSNAFPVPLMVGLDVLTNNISNSLTTNVQVRLIVSKGVHVNGTPTLLAIKSSGSTANLVLSYVAGLSDPSAGKLVFANTTAGVLGNTNSTVNGVVIGGISFVLNATSTFGGNLIVDAATDVAPNTTPGNVSTTFVSTYAQTIPVTAYKPGLTPAAPGGIKTGTAPHPVTAQTVSFTLQYNEAVRVTGVPVIRAIGASGAANVNVAFANASSNVANGTLVFSNTSVDLTGANNGTLTLDSTSTLTGFSGIVGVTSGNLVQNTLGFSANTITIAAS